MHLQPALVLQFMGTLGLVFVCVAITNAAEIPKKLQAGSFGETNQFQQKSADALVGQPNNPGGFPSNLARNYAQQKPQVATNVNPGNKADSNSPPMKASGIVLISAHPACREDIMRICREDPKTNYRVMECLYDKRRMEDQINPSCQTLIWQYKRNITIDERFDSATESLCKEDIAKVPECQPLPVGHKMACMMEHKQNITSVQCKKFINRMEMIAFSDYRLVYKFAEDCQSDIDQFECGRLHTTPDDDPHSQGKTLECLSKHVKELHKQCKHQILRVAELQSEDYQLDRPLYYACREDREKFCSDVRSGSGKVQTCLLHHKFDKTMSEECREQLTRRQKMMAVDVKVNSDLFQACQDDIRKYQCLEAQHPDKFVEARQSKTILCLEGALRDQRPLSGHCTYALRQTRRSLLEDYQINPELVSACADVIVSRCNGLDRGGNTIHCLMGLIKKSRKQNEVPAECQRAVEDVIEAADPGEDFEMDPMLKKACQSTVQAICPKRKPEEVMACLMNNIDDDQMSDACETKLLELQFFMARDFKLDRGLYKDCKENAVDLCSAEDKWHRSSTNPSRGAQVFACLYEEYKYGQETRLSVGCKEQVRRVLEQRAIRVDLNPRIQMSCLDDLSAFCSEKTKNGEEMACLQKYYKDLEEGCRAVVQEFARDEDENVRMDRQLFRVCKTTISTVCKGVNTSDLMKCLIQNKNADDVETKCMAAIHHHQLVTASLGVSPKLRKLCQDDIEQVCPDDEEPNDIITCLSLALRNNILNNEPPSVSKQCREQLMFEFRQKTEDVELDQDIFSACKIDRETHCSGIKPGGGRILGCLKKNQKQLSPACAKKLFKREEIANALGPKSDFALYSNCKRMIKVHCQESSKEDLFKCLLEHKKDDSFDTACKQELVKNLRLRAKDIQLNVKLFQACRHDIPKYCETDLQAEESGGEIMKSKVMNCLRIKFSQRKLSSKCENQLAGLVEEAAKDYKQDPGLAEQCGQEIKQFCAADVEAENFDDQEQVQECLKETLKEGKIRNLKCVREIARVLAESKVDVHADPILYKACSVDLANLCKDVPRGEGRQMSCLLSALEHNLHLQRDCKHLLEQRKTMWEYAAEQAPPETLQEVVQGIVSSPQRNSMFSILFMFIGFIFIFGLCCGRVTKRAIRQQIKNK